ncbi:Ribokinase-like protein [Ochromonadaceae sp. CCMP2298]|nr:Ribokinase-like protein [Ochromonadaceae sp. CCMP2298]
MYCVLCTVCCVLCAVCCVLCYLPLHKCNRILPNCYTLHYISSHLSPLPLFLSLSAYHHRPDRLTRLGRVFSEPWGVSCQMLVSTLGEDGCVLLLPSGGSGGSGGGLLERARSTAQRHPKDYAVWGQMEQRIGALSTINTTEEVQVILGREYRVISCSALPLSCVTDSTGAGDAFIGAFIAAWVHGWAPPNCMKLGTLGAGMKLQQQGARAGQPTLQQVIDILDQSA